MDVSKEGEVEYASCSSRIESVWGYKTFAGSGAPELSQKIADYLGQPLSEREVIEFPNEIFL